jgi:prolyl oligopeptidase
MIQKIRLHRAVLFAIALLFTTHFTSACAEFTSMSTTESTTMMSTINYPETKQVNVVEKPFGQTVSDPYRWLENDVRNDKEVAAWVESQNKVTNSYLNTLPGRDIFRDRLKQLYNYEQFSIPVKQGGRYFYLHNSGLQNQAVLHVRDSVDGAGRVLIDPNRWAKDGATALAEWSASDNGERVAYAVQDARIGVRFGCWT